MREETINDAVNDAPLAAGAEGQPLKVVVWERKTAALTRPSLPCLAGYHTLNLTAGCPNECCYCYAQSYEQHPGWGTVAFYANMLGKLREELPRLREKPRLVYFSTASEPFLPVERIMNDQYEIMASLLDCGAQLLISTKGVIQPRFASLFGLHPGKVRVQVGITTLDDTIRQVIEPRAATVAQRLANLELLLGAGVEAEARIDPLVPGLTDTPESLNPFIRELTRRGVRRAAVSFLFLRAGIKLPADMAWGRWSAREMKRLYTHKVTDYCGGGRITLPNALYRRARYNEIKAEAALAGLTVRLCRCKNDDLTEECCHPPLPMPDCGEQLTLF